MVLVVSTLVSGGFDGQLVVLMVLVVFMVLVVLVVLEDLMVDGFN